MFKLLLVQILLPSLRVRVVLVQHCRPTLSNLREGDSTLSTFAEFTCSTGVDNTFTTLSVLDKKSVV